jgi:hypothetical protein
MATIVTRAGKGEPLTHVEVDANFTNLNTDKVESSALATVATTGAYSDLTGTPTIPTDFVSAASGGTFVGNVDFSSGLDVTGNVTVTGSVDGRDVGADGTKLDGIEAGADITDTANVTAAGALMDSELTNITAVKALNQGVATTDGPTFSGLIATGIVLGESIQESYTALSGTTPSVDADAAGSFALTTSGNTTFTFAAVTTGRSVGFVLKITAGGSHTIAWPASVDWAGGTAPDAPAAGETDVLVFYTVDGGTNWYGFRAGDAMA